MHGPLELTASATAAGIETAVRNSGGFRQSALLKIKASALNPDTAYSK